MASPWFQGDGFAFGRFWAGALMETSTLFASTERTVSRHAVMWVCRSCRRWRRLWPSASRIPDMHVMVWVFWLLLFHMFSIFGPRLKYTVHLFSLLSIRRITSLSTIVSGVTLHRFLLDFFFSCVLLTVLFVLYYPVTLNPEASAPAGAVCLLPPCRVNLHLHTSFRILEHACVVILGVL